MNTNTTHQLRKRLPYLPMVDLTLFLPVVFAGAVAVTMLGTFVASRWTTISASMVEVLSGLGLWFVAIMSGWAAFTYIPLYVANGRTRKEGVVGWGLTAAGMSVAGALMIMLAFAVERAVYNAADWVPNLSDRHWFSSGYEVHAVFGEYLVSMLVMATLGGFVGISVYRSRDWGWGAVGPALLLAGLAGAFERGNIRFIGFVSQDMFGIDGDHFLVHAFISVVVAALSALFTWLVARDVSLRNV